MTMNWHLTTAGTAESNGATDSPPGHFPADETRADAWVAPAGYVSAYVAEHDPDGRFEATRADAVRAFRSDVLRLETALDGRGVSVAREVAVAMVATYHGHWSVGAMAAALSGDRSRPTPHLSP